MSRLRLTGWFLVAACALVARPGALHVQAETSTGAGFHWDPGALPLSFVINDAGSDDVADASDELAIRLGFQTWEDVAYADFAFAEDGDPVERARTDWQADDIHLVLFDEDDSSGYFPPGSGLLATSVLEVDELTGEILDGDVLFNGSEYGFASDPELGDFDIWSLAVHEAGHLVGLGHSALGGASMAPFLDPGRVLTRSLSADDVSGLERLYPAGLRAEVSGTIERSGGAPVSGAHVWILSQANGRISAATLSAADGSYRLSGLEPGNYRVFAGPLDATLTPDDLSNPNQPFLDTFFQPAQSSQVSIVGVASIVDVDVVVGDDSALTITAPKTALTLHRGSSTTVELDVTGFSTISSVTVPFSTVVTVESFTVVGTKVQVELAAQAAAPIGLYDLQVLTSLGTLATLNGFVDVVEVAPTLSSSNPDCGGNAGADSVAMLGEAFGSAPRVLFGDTFGEVTFVGPGGGALLVTPPTDVPTGAVDVVLLAADGQEVRVPGGYLFVEGGAPLVTNLFPESGDELGGTEITILGSGFGPDTLVFFDNEPAASVTLESASQLSVVMPALPGGVYDVTLIYADCTAVFDLLSDAFTSVAAPDPTVSLVTPFDLSQAGSEAITITGTGFLAGAQAELFADPLSGLGGTPLTTVFVSPTQLTASTPPGPLPGGLASVLVRLTTGQSGVLADAVQINAPEVLAVQPSLLARTGGDTITVTGSDFDDTAVVELFTDLDTYSGGTPLATTFVDSQTLTAVLPTGPLPGGPANVAVIMAGPLLAGLDDALTLADPSVDAVSPATVLASGGTSLTVSGFGFESGSVVEVFNDPLDFSGGTALATTFVDAETLTAQLPAGPLPVGQATLVVQVLGGALEVGLENALEVLPEIAAVTPGTVAQTGGDVLTVSGVGFEPGTQVEVFNDPIDLTGGTPLATTVLDNGTVEAVLPAGPLPLGPANLAVVVPGALPVGLGAAFSVAPPTIATVSPGALAVVGGDTLTVTGFGFVDGAVVTLFADPLDFSGGTPLATTFVDAGTLSAVTPAGPLPAGLACVAVELPGGLVVGVTDAVSIVSHSVEAVAPGLISHVGGEELVVTGALFVDGAVVELFTDPLTFSGGLALATTFVSAGELRAITPGDGALTPGPVNVAVRLPGDSVVVVEGQLEVATAFEDTNLGEDQLDEDDASDTVLVDALEGSAITLLAKRQGKQSTLEPTLTVFGPSGDKLLSTDPDDEAFDAAFVKTSEKQAAVKAFVLPETGRYAIEVGRVSGAGAYRFQYKEKVSKALSKLVFNAKAPAEVGPGQDLVLAVPSKADSLAKLKFKAAKDSDLILGLTVTAADDSVLLTVFGDGSMEGDPAWIAATQVLKEGQQLTIKNGSLPLFGESTFTLSSANGGAALVTGSLLVKPIKKKAFFSEL